MNKKLNAFWENDVDKANKHFIGDLPPDKTQRMLKRVDKHILSHLDFEKIHTSLDWGSGGGLFSKILAQKSKLIAADLSEESLAETKRYTGNNSIQTLLIPENPENIALPDDEIDLLFCHAVIHHFPSPEYAQTIFNLWTQKIRPKFFGLHIKIGDKTIEKGNYFQGKNFLNALYLNENDFVNTFTDTGYKVVNKAYEINRYSNPEHTMKVGYFVFKKE